MKVLIRNATVNDVTLLSELGSRTFFETFAEQNTKEDMETYLTETFNVNAITKQINDPASIFFIIESEGQTAGYAKMRKEDHKSVEIERIYISKDFQGKKLGKILIEKCIKYAEQKKFERIWLGVWENNTKAIEFYKSFGFAAFGSHIFMLGKDPQNDILMERKLG